MRISQPSTQYGCIFIFRINNGAARLRQIEQSFHVAAEDAPVAMPPALPPPMFQSASSNKKKVTIVEDKNTESCV